MLTLLLIASLQEAPPRPLFPAEQAAIKKAMDPDLLDGAGARYIWPKFRGGVVYCGWINAKNSYGAYIGYRLFMVLGFANQKTKLKLFTPDERTYIEDPSKPDFPTKFIYEQCAKNGYNISRPSPE